MIVEHGSCDVAIVICDTSLYEHVPRLAPGRR